VSDARGFSQFVVGHHGDDLRAMLEFAGGAPPERRSRKNVLPGKSSVIRVGDSEETV
jgi:hypothetical protein